MWSGCQIHVHNICISIHSYILHIYNSKEKVYSYRYLCITLRVFAKEISINTVVRVDSLWSGRPYSCAKSYILHIYNSKEKVYSYRYLCIALGVFAKEISIHTVVRVDSLWSGRPYSCAKFRTREPGYKV